MIMLLLSSLNGEEKETGDLFIHLWPRWLFPLIDVDHQKSLPSITFIKMAKKASMQKRKTSWERQFGERFPLQFSVGWCFLDKESKEPTHFLVSVGNSQKKRQVKVTTTWWMAITHRHRAPCVTQLTFFLLFLFCRDWAALNKERLSSRDRTRIVAHLGHVAHLPQPNFKRLERRPPARAVAIRLYCPSRPMTM